MVLVEDESRVGRLLHLCGHSHAHISSIAYSLLASACYAFIFEVKDTQRVLLNSLKNSVCNKTRIY